MATTSHPDEQVVKPTADDDQVAKPGDNDSPVAGMGLPTWMEELFEPGVGPKVFMTLKGSLFGLNFILGAMIYYITEPSIRIHLYVFFGMSCVLLLLVLWFVSEMQSAQASRKQAKSD